VEDFDPTRPKWEQIADAIQARIDSGEYPPRHRLSEVQLEAEFGVARGTVRKAVGHLRKQGAVTTVVGMGSFVAPRT
jgi:GntR family transcriptional regulator